ncbi:MAG: P-loop NTPase fold protein, partial [Holosporales bacterium]
MAADTKDVNVSLCTGDVTPETPLHDQLKRIPFAKSIAALIQKNAKGKIVIGIEGEWGEGKTYTIELIRREIEAYNKDRNKKEETIAWMVFNPWHFTDRQHLASLFLRDLAIFIEQKLEIKPPKWRIWLEKHSQRLGGWIELICLPLVVYGYSDISNLLLHYASKLQNFKDTRSPKTLETLKDDIKKKLSDKSLPFSQIVVAVEDMDRLNPEEIRAMLQLMKMIADFPKIIYLLAYDRTHVVNALGDLAGHRA